MNHAHYGSSRSSNEGVVPFSLQVQLQLIHIRLPVDLRICEGRVKTRLLRCGCKTEALTWYKADDELREDGITEDDECGEHSEVLWVRE